MSIEIPESFPKRAPLESTDNLTLVQKLSRCPEPEYGGDMVYMLPQKQAVKGNKIEATFCCPECEKGRKLTLPQTLVNGFIERQKSLKEILESEYEKLARDNMEEFVTRAEVAIKYIEPDDF